MTHQNGDRSKGSATQATIASHLKKSNLVVEIVMEMKNPESIDMVGQCEPGIVFISTFAVETELRAKNLNGT